MINYKLAFSLMVAIFTLGCNSSNVELTIAPVFSDQMVLQQDQSNAVWGTATPSSQITLTPSWGEKIITKADGSGNWILRLPTPSYDNSIHKEGQSFQVSDGSSTIEIKDVLIGEVWLASGQSNMEWRMNQCDGCVINQIQEIENSTNDFIRMFSVPQDLSGESIKFRKWLSASPENTGSFSATAYYFAKKLHDKLKIPIGVVNTSWGGTRIESWISPQKLNLLDETKDLIPNDYSFLGYQDHFKRQNDSISTAINQKYGYTTFYIPKVSENMELWHEYSKEWEALDLGDKLFKNTDFDDSSWENWIPILDNFGGLISSGRFEAVFEESEPLLSDGVIWFRTLVDISDPTKDYVLKVEKGIDDIDQTYFNGELIGSTFGWAMERNYTIPKELIKKGMNLLAFRVTDTGGGGGFNSPVEIGSGHDIIDVPFENFKFKHHGFVSNGHSIIVHNHTKDQLYNIEDEKRKDISKTTPLNSPNGFSAMYECMLSPVMPYGAKGVIWYQGESNVSNYDEYTNLLSGMIEDWRTQWDADLPFYFAQIAPWNYDKSLNSANLRDAQRKVLDKVDKTGMAVLLDIGEKHDIHPENKKDVGERLSFHALKNEYNFDIVADGPLYSKHSNNGKYIEVSFDHLADGLTSEGELIGFEVAGPDGVFFPAEATIFNNKIRTFSKDVSNPIHVRYGWQNWFIGTLFNSEGLPASSFSSL